MEGAIGKFGTTDQLAGFDLHRSSRLNARPLNKRPGVVETARPGDRAVETVKAALQWPVGFVAPGAEIVRDMPLAGHIGAIPGGNERGLGWTTGMEAPLVQAPVLKHPEDYR